MGMGQNGKPLRRAIPENGRVGQPPTYNATWMKASLLAHKTRFLIQVYSWGFPKISVLIST